MFQYTTETIINSNVGKLPGGKRFGVLSVGDSSIQSTGDFFVVDGVNSFKISCISKIYKTPYRAESRATATLDLTSATIPAAGKIVRLTVAIREQGSVRSTIQNAYLHKSKPFHYELAVPTATAGSEADALVDALVALIKKDMAMTDFAYFKAAADGTGKKLVLEADDCYIQFEDVKLEEVLEIEDNATPLAAKLLGYNVTAPIAGLSLVKTPGDEGQGTVARLVKNLRIPTNASINPFAADQGGKPIPGGQYTQYLIEYETERAHVAGVVVGSVGEVSRTSHVFFVEAGALTDWDAELAKLGKTVVAAGRPAKGASRTAGTANAVDTISTSAAGVTELTEKDPHVGSVE